MVDNKNQGTHTVFRNTLALSTAWFSIRLVSAFISIYIARHYGKSQFGSYETAFNLTYAFVLFIDFGLSALVVKKGATLDKQLNQYFGTSLILKSPLAIVALVGMLLLCHLGNYSSLTKNLIYIFVFYAIMAGYLISFQSILQSYQHLVLLSKIMLIFSLIDLVFSVLACSLGLDIIVLAMCRLLVQILFLIFLVALCIRRYILPKFSLKIIPTMLNNSFWYGIRNVFSSFFIRSDVVVLSMLAPISEVGVFAAGVKLILFLQVIPYALSYSLTPEFFRLGKLGSENLKISFEKTLRLSLAFSIPLTIGIYMFAKPIIGILYGVEYLDSVRILKITSLVIIPTFITALTGNTLWGLNRERFVALITGGSLLGNLILDYTFIKQWGVEGAAWALVCGHTFLILAQWVYINKYLFSVHLDLKSLVSFIACSLLVGTLGSSLMEKMEPSILATICLMFVSVGIFLLLIKNYLPKEDTVIFFNLLREKSRYF